MEKKDLCKEFLQDKIYEMEKSIKSAKACLADGDFLQCAVRLEGAGPKFDNFTMNIFDSMSNE